MDFPRRLSVEPRPDYRIYLTYDDGTQGEYNVNALIQRGKVFAPLADLPTFDAVELINNGHAIAWPGEVDLCADSLYLKLIGKSYEEWSAHHNYCVKLNS
jgi:Protein of unknown function (DUF2442)